ncbi:DNA replication licensing factor mcm2 [Hordeum vulgare]|nr:DNA replication licensing factor mcm2 [Hordeum vulgare]
MPHERGGAASTVPASEEDVLTDRLPPNTTTSRGATDPSSYSDDDGEAEVDPNVHPEEDDGEDLFNDDYLK